MRTPRSIVKQATGEASATPLLTLFILNMVDELDQVTYGVAGPDIRDTFGIPESTVVTVGALSAALIIMLVVPVSYQADRRNRVQMVSIAALAWGSMSILTGLSGFIGVLGLLIIARIGAGLGRVMNEPVHVSLLADYYPREQHGRVYSIHRAANAIGAGLVLLCGLLADAVGWRFAFMLLATPTFVAWTLLKRIQEPVRGASLDQSLALRADANSERIPFRAAWRHLKTIPTLRRSWAAGFALGAGVVPVAVMFNFFFETEYGIESNTARAAITTVYAVGSLAGLQVGSRFSTLALMAGDLPKLTVYAASALAILALGFLGMALAPWLAVSIAFVFLLGTSACINSFGLPILAAVSPPRLRSQALGYFVFFIGLGAAFVTPVVSSLGEQVSYRLSISLLSLVMLASAAVFVSARHQVREDADRAFAEFQAEAG